MSEVVSMALSETEAKILRQVLLERKISQDYIAHFIGVSQKHISLILSRKAKVSRSTAKKFYEALEKHPSVDFLVNGVYAFDSAQEQPSDEWTNIYSAGVVALKSVYDRSDPYTKGTIIKDLEGMVRKYESNGKSRPAKQR